jgi:hypothetical protein
LLKLSRQKDYYKVLGVSRDADEKTIKKALCVPASPTSVYFLANALFSILVAKLHSLHTPIRAAVKPRWLS